MMKPTPKTPHFLKYIIDCGKKYCQHKAVITVEAQNQFLTLPIVF